MPLTHRHTFTLRADEPELSRARLAAFTLDQMLTTEELERLGHLSLALRLRHDRPEVRAFFHELSNEALLRARIREVSHA